MTEPPPKPHPWPLCSLLLFVATSAEEEALKAEALHARLPFRKNPDLNKSLKQLGFGGEAWELGRVGKDTVIAVGPSRLKGDAVMGPHGRLGTAAKGLRYLAATGAQGIIQLGMAFGIAPRYQNLGDVLVSTSLVPYDNRDVRPSPDEPGYVNDYSRVRAEPSQGRLVDMFRREKDRTTFAFSVTFGAMLSGAARIHSGRFRDELVRSASEGNDPIVGGEMEGVGLLAATLSDSDPVWCVVKGISDFADERQGEDVKAGRIVAPRNAARFVLSSLVNDASTGPHEATP